jgi:hypothetical protein
MISVYNSLQLLFNRGDMPTKTIYFPELQGLKASGNKTVKNYCATFSTLFVRKKLRFAFVKNVRGESSLICKEGCRFSMGWCIREPYCRLSSVVCNATIPTLPLFEMAESACSPFCYVLHYFCLSSLYRLFITYA